MKKLAMGLFLILGLASFAAQNNVEVKAGYDFGGKYDVDDFKGSSKAKNGAFEIGAEYRYEVSPGFEVGGGIAYQSHKNLKEKDYNGKKVEAFNSVPVYATAKYTFDTGVVKPYVKGDLGYSFNTDKFNNGMYYGAGVGVSYNNFNAELMYKENKSRIDTWWYDGNLNYKRVTLGVGYTFGF